ncbi:LigA (fragment) [Frankia canadensis]|uniref:LigA n=1 Tax=Frankia canadensis TaxID=1836972 RepID=A0A2I2L2K1_9ACTN
MFDMSIRFGYPDRSHRSRRADMRTGGGATKWRRLADPAEPGHQRLAPITHTGRADHAFLRSAPRDARAHPRLGGAGGAAALNRCAAVPSRSADR